MPRTRRARRCRICRKRPPWSYKNCPPGVCKRCYHKHVWPHRSGGAFRRADDSKDIMAEAEVEVFDRFGIELSYDADASWLEDPYEIYEQHARSYETRW